jgi:hypothetical protein
MSHSSDNTAKSLLFKKVRRLTLTRIRRELTMRTHQVKKNFYQWVKKENPRCQKRLLFILGCQRSGTSLMQRVFERDLNAHIYKESSRLSVQHSFWAPNIRLRPFDEVKMILERDRFPFVIAKPLVESQNTLKLLEYFSEAKVLWLYRHYRDVASSNLSRFGKENGVELLRPLAENHCDDWKAEHVPDHLRYLVQRYFSEDMNPYDAAALFWFIRNSFFFEYQLSEHPLVMLMKYEDFVRHPVERMQNIYDFAEAPFPGANLLKEVHATSVGKGRHVKFSPEIEQICYTMLAKLDRVYQYKQSYAKRR